MTDAAVIAQPALIVVAGRPGAGKTTLAHSLARAIRCPAICRDEIKEGLVSTTGAIGEDDDDLARHANGVFFDTLALLLGRRITVVAEAAFQHKLWAPGLEPLRTIARVRIVLCNIDPDLARTRRDARGLADRAREQFHQDVETRMPGAGRSGSDRPVGSYDPPRLDVPMLTVDTSDGYRPAFEMIVEFARV